MARKTSTRKIHTSSGDIKLSWHFFVPGMVGGAIAFIFSGDFILALQVFAVVVIAQWIIRKYA